MQHSLHDSELSDVPETKTGKFIDIGDSDDSLGSDKLYPQNLEGSQMVQAL